MRKTKSIKIAVKNEKHDKLNIIIEVLLDIRELLKKNNEMLRRGRTKE